MGRHRRPRAALIATAATLVAVTLVILHAPVAHAAASACCAHTFTVTSTGDAADAHPGDGVCASTAAGGPCTLRAAIQEANATGGDDQIAFAIGSGTQTIAPASALPAITESAVLNAESQPGFSGSPVIALDGSSAGAAATGITITANSVTVEGFDIVRFGGTGISAGGTGTVVKGNFIGVTTSGCTAAANGGDGINVAPFGANTVIGGSSAAGVRNVISANGGNGVSVALASSVKIQGNLIGSGLCVFSVLGNAKDGVLVTSASGTTIGSTGAGSSSVANSIFFNGTNGVELVNADNTSVRANSIGTNGDAGVRVGFVSGTAAGSATNSIGGPESGAGNSLNLNADGIALVGSLVTGTLIRGNTITNSTRDGISISGAQGTAIGGGSPATRNVISGNGRYGVFVTGASATGTVLHGNFIGTNTTGNAANPNVLDGVYVQAPGVAIGGTNSGEGNVISGNTGAGVSVNGGVSSRTTIFGNVIGLAANGAVLTTSNGGGGIAIANAPGIVVGGKDDGEPNVVSGNTGNGIQIDGSAATGNSVLGNLIGTDATGLLARGNKGAGVEIGGAPGNTIGGIQAGEGNVIAANGNNGVLITGSSASGNTITGNDIGVSLASGTPTRLGNTGQGVFVDGAPGNTIGGQVGQGGNLIGANQFTGIAVDGAAGNTISGNLVGTDGTRDLGNGFNGVVIESPTTVGGQQQQANVISGNGGSGIVIASDDVTVTGNLIGVGSDGRTAIANDNQGVSVIAGTSGIVIGGVQADLQNVIGGNTHSGIGVFGSGSATISGVVIQGNLIGRAGTAGAPNGDEGISLGTNVTGTLVGGAPTPAGNPSNTIAGNGKNGVVIFGLTGNRVQNNSIFGNGRLGIDLIGDGVTHNDSKDADTGPNNLQNFPTITKAAVEPGALSLTGSLNTAPGVVITVDVYASSSCDPTHFGEGETFVGEATLPATDTNGNVSFTNVLVPAGAPVPVGSRITATATDESGNTSEFSSCATSVEGLAELSVTLTGSPEPARRGDVVLYTITATNTGPDPAVATVLTQKLPAQLTFVSASTPVGSCDQIATGVSCDLQTIPPGGSIVVKVKAQVSSAASGPLTTTATVASSTTDPTSANDDASFVTHVNTVGTFTFSPVTSSVLPGKFKRYRLAWTDPVSVGDLSSVELRLRLGAEVVFRVRWNRTGDTFALFDPATGAFGPPVPVGQKVVITAGDGSLDVGRSTAAPSNPKTIVLGLKIALAPTLARSTLAVEAQATSVGGDVSGWLPAGTIAVKH